MLANSAGAAKCAVSVEDIRKALQLPTTAVIQVSEVTDLGYDRTFLVACSAHETGAEQRWCLRVFAPSSNRLRVKHAMHAFAVSGVTPHLEHMCEQWSLEKWLGPTFCLESSTVQSMRAIGALIAQVHKSVPTTWFDDHIALVREEFPALAHMHQHDIAAHALVRLAGGVNVDNSGRDTIQYRMLADPANAALCQSWASAHICMPRYAQAQRLVTLHGDIHAGNLVHDSKSNNELRCIDLELAATGHAIFDIARAVASLTTQLSTTCSESEMREKALLLSYIQCMGLPAPSHHVLECLRVDCRLYYFTTRYLYLRHLPCCASSCQGILHAVHAYILRVRQSPSLCIELLRAIDPSAYVADTLGVRLHMLGSLACRPC